MSTDPRRAGSQDGGFVVAAELGLLALTLGTVGSLTRLFDGVGFVGRLFVPVAAAWALALVLRRLGLGALVATGLHLVAGVFVLCWWFVPDTLAIVFPTPASAVAVADLVSASFSEFSELIAPVPAQDGFLIVIAAVLWVFAGFADTASMRFAAPVQAAVPATAAFVAIGILAREPGRLAAAVWFLVGIGVYAVTQRGLRGLGDRWVAGRSAAGARAVAASASVVVLVALVAGLAVGPRLPGDTEAVVDLRELGRGSAPRTVVSPFVGLRSLLGQRSNEVMFEVTAAAPSYWRLTSLEAYDPEREIWVSEAQRYRSVSGSLPPTFAPGVPTEPLTQRVDVSGLAGLWLPAAYAPATISGLDAASYNEQTSSLYLRDAERASGTGYVLDSSVPRFAGLEAAAPPSPGSVPEPLLAVPELAPVVTEQVRAVTGATDRPYEQLIALQGWFREEFDYDEQIDLSGEPDALVAFLEQRRGFCQQFSSAFALMARSLGLPSRVAVGFTPGDLDDGTFVVRGRHAHAWPEVYFEGVGWVPFEPTPQRGDPQSADHTGVPPQQAPAPRDDPATTTTEPAPAPDPTTAPDPSPSDDIAATAGGQDPEQEPGTATTGSRWWIAAAVAAGTVAVLTVVLVRLLTVRARRTRTGAQRDRLVEHAWRDAVRALAPLGLRPSSSETPDEFAARVDLTLGTALLAPLARHETRRRYAQDAPSDAACSDATGRLESLRTHVRALTTRRDRVGSLVRARR